MRGVLDPKNRKTAVQGQVPKHAVLGRILGEGEREAGKDRDGSLVQQLVQEERASGRFKSKYRILQEKAASGGKLYYRYKVAKRRRQR